jgi:hypothetical protein
MKENNGALHFSEADETEILKEDGDIKSPLMVKPQGNPYKPQMTIYRDIRKPKDGVSVDSFAKVLYYLSGEDKFVKERTEYIQNHKNELLSDEDIKLRKSSKSSLPAACFNAMFRKRGKAGFLGHSGLMVLDYDGYESKEIMLGAFEKFIQKPTTYLAFVSPSGLGVKVITRISESTTIEEHVLKFNEYYKRDGESKYFDHSGKDIARACFIPYDPNFYLNEDAIEFGNDLDLKPVPKANLNSVVVEKSTPVSKSDSETALKRCSDIIENSSDGNRHEARLRAGTLLGGFIEGGVIKEHIGIDALVQVVLNNTTAPDVARKELLSSIKHGKKSPIYSLNKRDLSYSEYTEQNSTTELPFFWKRNEDLNGKINYVVLITLFTDWLEDEGYFTYNGSEKGVSYARVKNNILTRVTPIEIWRHTAKRIKEVFGNEMLEIVQKHSQKLMRETCLTTIASKDLDIRRDPKDSATLFYKNTGVKITVDGIALLPYSELEKPIWESAIIDRDFKISPPESDFSVFMSNVFSKRNHLASRTMIGYLLHRYKDPAFPIAIILNDQINGGGPNGGAGKGLIVQAIGRIRNIVVEDGKNFSLKKNFAAQLIDLDTDVFSIDDAKEGIDFENLFLLISEGFAIEKKHEGKIIIPFSESPKMVISSNYAIGGTGNSHDRRKKEFELLPYYGAKRTPRSEFGKSFFTEWNSREWLGFDNFMMGCIQDFLKNGLLECENINLKDNKLISNVGISFIEFMEEFKFSGGEFHARTLSKQFMASASIDRLSDKVFKYKVEAWSNHFKLKFRNYRDGNNGTMYHITNPKITMVGPALTRDLKTVNTVSDKYAIVESYCGMDPSYFCAPERVAEYDVEDEYNR